ncbi:MAG: hypothetical protein QM689_08945 [Oscillospiraceae bacterium]
MKKILALSLSLLMSISLLSACGKEDPSSDDSKSAANTTTTTAANSAVTTTTQATTTTILTTQTATSELPASGDFKNDGAYAKAFTKSMAGGKYTMEMSANMAGTELSMTMVVSGNKGYAKTESAGVKSDMYFADGKMYVLIPSLKQYYVMDNVDISTAVDLPVLGDDMKPTQTKLATLDGTEYITETYIITDPTAGKVTAVYYFDKDSGDIKAIDTQTGGESVAILKITSFKATADEKLTKLPDLSDYSKIEM